MADNEAAPPATGDAPHVAATRGKLQVSISDEGFDAGRLNTVSIVISNPFDVAVEIIGIESPQSSFLKRKRQPNEVSPANPEKNIVAGNITSTSTHARSGFWRSVSDRLYAALPGLGGVVLGTVSLGEASLKWKSRESLTLSIVAQEKSDIELEQNLDDFEEVSLVAHKDAKLKIKAPHVTPNADKNSKGFEIQVVEPHCEMVAYVPLHTQGWLFFKPTRMNLTYLVRYRFVDKTNGKIMTQVVMSALDVRPPLRSVMIGSIIGATLGGAARYLQQIGKTDNLALADLKNHVLAEMVNISGAMIMSVIAAIALSRKTGAQSFITVEDFFGGFVIGVLIGYQGPGYFDSIINKIGSPGGSPATGSSVH